jgi:hypothetical protein
VQELVDDVEPPGLVGGQLGRQQVAARRVALGARAQRQQQRAIGWKTCTLQKAASLT